EPEDGSPRRALRNRPAPGARLPASTQRRALAVGSAGGSRIAFRRHRSNPGISFCPAAGTRHGALSKGEAAVLPGNRCRFVLFSETGPAHRIAARTGGDGRAPIAWTLD